jgi:carboxyl-terminal processing protease
MDRLRGEKGTTVNVSILRNNMPDLIDYTIERDKIPINSIDANFMLNKNVGYIKLNRFSKTSMEEFYQSMAELTKAGMENLVLDLRGNSGGFLNVAVELSDEFLEEGKLIVYTKGLKSPRQDFLATAKGNFEKGKLVVLINEGSASASEIVSGAVQDWDRGIVIGRRSFGKGLVQRPFQLPDGAVIRLTAARYYTPSGRSIQRPYDEGSENYFKDLIERQRKGELVNADSIHFPDSLKYFTAAKRTVFGGGGIMPDIFVPVDTLHFTTYYSNLIRKGVFNRYTIDFSNAKRDEIKKSYKTTEKFVKGFEVDEAMMTDFLALAEKEQVEFDEALYQRSEDFIRMQIKALIARNLWDMEAYYQVVSEQDETILQALEILEKNDMFSEVIHPNIN